MTSLENAIHYETQMNTSPSLVLDLEPLEVGLGLLRLDESLSYNQNKLIF